MLRRSRYTRRGADFAKNPAESPHFVHVLMTGSLLWKKVSYLLTREAAVRNDPASTHCPSFQLLRPVSPGRFFAASEYRQTFRKQ